MENKER
jgi:hypothetical protein